MSRTTTWTWSPRGATRRMAESPAGFGATTSIPTDVAGSTAFRRRPDQDVPTPRVLPGVSALSNRRQPAGNLRAGGDGARVSHRCRPRMDSDHRPDVVDGGYAGGTWTTRPIRCRMDGDDGRDDAPIGDATHVRVRSQRGASPRLAGRDRFARHDVSRRVADVWSR